MADTKISTETPKDDMQVEKEKLESVKRADAAVKSMHDFTSPEVLYKELISSVLKYHPSTDISMIKRSPRRSEKKVRRTLHYPSFMCSHYPG